MAAYISRSRTECVDTDLVFGVVQLGLWLGEIVHVRFMGKAGEMKDRYKFYQQPW